MTTAKATIVRMGRKRKEPDASRYSGRLAARLRERREALGKTVEDIAEKLEIPASTYYSYEAHTNLVPLDILPSLCRVLKVRMPDLMPEK